MLTKPTKLKQVAEMGYSNNHGMEGLAYERRQKEPNKMFGLGR